MSTLPLCPKTTLSPEITIAPAITNKEKIPVLAVGVNPEIPKGFMIQSWPSSNDYAIKISEESKVDNIKKLGVIYRNDDLGIAAKEAQKRGLIFIA